MFYGQQYTKLALTLRKIEKERKKKEESIRREIESNKKFDKWFGPKR